MDKLTARQEAFVREYLIDLNATGAARRAGYKGNDNTLGAMASALLRNRKVALVIQKGMDKRAERVQITADDVLRELLLIAKMDPSKAYDLNGRLLPIHEMPEEARRCISAIDIYKDFTEGVEIGETQKVRFWDKPKALEMLGRHLKLFVDKIEHSGISLPQVVISLPDNGRSIQIQEKPKDGK